MNQIETIYFHITKQCNLCCSYCYFEAGKKEFEELKSKEIVNVINDLPLSNTKRIVFTGGEPLLRDDIFDLAKRIRIVDEKVIIGITTNGILINKHNSRELVRLFDEIRISIDGPRYINDLQRGNYSFNKAIKALKNIIKAGGNPSAFITATSKNIGHLKDFMKYLLSQGICKIHISPVKLVGRARDETLLCNKEELQNIVEEFYFEQFGIRIESNVNELFNCGVGKYISINPDGSVFPCHVLSFPELCIGNVKNEQLHLILEKSEIMKNLRNLNFEEISKCHDCFSELSNKKSCLGLNVKDYASRSQLLNYFENNIREET